MTYSCPGCGFTDDLSEYLDLRPFLGLVPPDKVIVSAAGCWLYGPALAWGTYGRIGEGYLHVLAWTRVNGGAPPAGMHVHHECHTRSCFYPGHLRLVTPAENYAEERKEKCVRGHVLAGSPEYKGRGRNCSKCKAARKRERREREGGVAHADR